MISILQSPKINNSILTVPNVLKVAAVCVAIPRMIGAGATLVGERISDLYPWYLPWEIFSNAGLGLLEGIAIAYIAVRLPKIGAKTIQGKIIIVLLVAMGAALVLTGVPFVLTEQENLSLVELFPSRILRGIWSLTVLSAPILVLAGIGLAAYEPEQDQSREELDELRSELETSQSDLERSQRELDQLRSDLETSQLDLETSQSDLSCPSCGRNDFKTSQGLGKHIKTCSSISENGSSKQLEHSR